MRRISRFLLLAVVGVSLFVPATAHALVVYDDFESYPLLSPIDGRPGWAGGDSIPDLRNGWIVTDDGSAPYRYIRFWPTPRPGGFNRNSNWEIFHADSATPITTLLLEMDYIIQTSGDMQVWLSASGIPGTGDNVTSELGLQEFNAMPFRSTGKVDLSDHIAGLGITNDVYVIFQAAAYSSCRASAWDKRGVETSYTSGVPVPVSSHCPTTLR